MASVRRMDVIDDRLLGRADEPLRAHDDLNDIHRLPGSPVEFYPQAAGPIVERKVAAVERLQ